MSLPCYKCGSSADTIHLVPNVVDTEHVLFACPQHDPQGYWFEVEKTGKFLRHIIEKRNGERTVGMILRALPHDFFGN